MHTASAFLLFLGFISIPLAIDYHLLSPNIVLFPLMLCFFLALTQIATALTHSRPSIGTLLIWSFVAWNFSLPGIAQFRYGFYWNLPGMPDRVAFTAGLLLLIFCSSFFLSHLAIRFRYGHMASREYRKPAPMPVSVSLVYVVAVSAIGLGASVVLQHGVDVFIQPRDAFDTFLQAAYPGLRIYYFILVAGVLFMALLYSGSAMHYAYNNGMHARAIYLLLCTVVLGAVNTVINNPYHLPRFIALAYGLMLILVLLFPWRFLLSKVFIALYPVASYVVSPAVNFLNRTGTHGFSDLSSFGFNVRNSLLHGDFGDFQMTMMAIYYVEREGIQFGKLILSALLFFVPRSWWEGKGTSGGVEVALLTGHDITNISVPIFSEMYMDFGFIGVVCTALLLAWLVNRIFRLDVVRSPHSHHYLLAAAFIGFLPIIMRGSLLSVIAPIAAVMVLPLVLGGRVAGLVEIRRRGAPTVRSRFQAARSRATGA